MASTVSLAAPMMTNNSTTFFTTSTPTVAAPPPIVPMETPIMTTTTTRILSSPSLSPEIIPLQQPLPEEEERFVFIANADTYITTTTTENSFYGNLDTLVVKNDTYILISFDISELFFTDNNNNNNNIFIHDDEAQEDVDMMIQSMILELSHVIIESNNDTDTESGGSTNNNNNTTDSTTTIIYCDVCPGGDFSNPDTMIDISPLPLDGFDSSIPEGTTEVSCLQIQEILAVTDLGLDTTICNIAAQFLKPTCGCNSNGGGGAGGSGTDATVPSPPPIIICDVCPDGQFTNLDTMIDIGQLPLGDLASVLPDGSSSTVVSCGQVEDVLAVIDIGLDENTCNLASQFLGGICGCELDVRRTSRRELLNNDVVPTSENESTILLRISRLLPPSTGTVLDIETLHSGLFNPSNIDAVIVGPTFEVAPDDVVVQVEISDLLNNIGQPSSSETQLLFMIESLDEGSSPNNDITTATKFHSRESEMPPQLTVVLYDDPNSHTLSDAPSIFSSTSEGPTLGPTPLNSSPGPTPDHTTMPSEVPSIITNPIEWNETTPGSTENNNDTISSLQPSLENGVTPVPSPLENEVTPSPSPLLDNLTNSPTEKVCAAATDEATCTIDGGVCVWCQQQQDDDDNNEVNAVCRNSQEECPGQGRGNPCLELVGLACENGECLWCADIESCTSSRGNDTQCPVVTDDATNSDNNINDCSLLLNDSNCTSNLACRWCNDGCTDAQSFCDDGSLGILGDPCADADTELTCPGECVWCALNSTCQNPSNLACTSLVVESDNNSTYDECQLVVLEPDCNATAECQWCAAEFRCELAESSCGDPRGAVGIELLETTGGEARATLVVQDDGLGKTDPNAVSVALEYLFEVTEDGTSILPSLIDFTFEEFTISQSVGNFFDNFDSDVLSRRISFETTIGGVGVIEMVVFIFMNAGIITTETGESWSVEKDDIKVDIRMRNWAFCDPVANPCGTSEFASEFVDVAIKIQGSNEEPDPSSTRSLVYNLGGNVPLELSNQVEVDGSLQEMPADFPRAESREGQGTVFVVRFPKFDNAVEYDLVIAYHQAFIDVDEAEDGTPPPSNSTEEPDEKPTGPEETVSSAAPSSATTAPVPDPTPTKTGDPDEKGDNDGSGGSIGTVVGAIIGVIVVVIIGGFCFYELYLMKKESQDEDDKVKDVNADANGGNNTMEGSFDNELGVINEGSGMDDDDFGTWDNGIR